MDRRIEIMRALLVCLMDWIEIAEPEDERAVDWRACADAVEHLGTLGVTPAELGVGDDYAVMARQRAEMVQRWEDEREAMEEG